MPAAVPEPAPRVPALDLHQPFTRAAALAAGITAKQLRGPGFRRLFTGVYLDASVEPQPRHRVTAALLLHPRGAFASHASAARVFEVPLPPGLHEEHVSVFAERDRRRRTGIRNHVVTGAEVVRYRGLAVSAPAQVFAELAEQLTLVDLVVAGDHLVGNGWVTPERLRSLARERGSPAAVRAAAYVRAHVDSPMETRLRMLIVLAGLPEPEVNVVLRHEGGRVRYRFDLGYPDLRIAVEYDGRQHRADLDRWDHDLERGEWLDDAGWLHVPVFSRGIYRQPDRTLARVAKALRTRGSREVPTRLADDWRPFFPVLTSGRPD